MIGKEVYLAQFFVRSDHGACNSFSSEEGPCYVVAMTMSEFVQEQEPSHLDIKTRGNLLGRTTRNFIRIALIPFRGSRVGVWGHKVIKIIWVTNIEFPRFPPYLDPTILAT